MPHLGLRGRVAASLVLTAAVALAVAAFGLLAPLERKLRTQEVRDLVSAAVQSRSSFRELDTHDPKLLATRLRLRVRRVATATGARVALLDPQRHVVVNTDPDAHDSFRDAIAALRTDRAVRRVVEGGSIPQARVAVRVPIEGRHYVLALRKPLREQHSAVVQVQRAFGTAALVALAVALLAAGFFAATVGRRVRKLRDAVERFRISDDAGELPAEHAGDEVGDLSRAFAEMARRVHREEEVRRAFVATASHELRTPLMTLQGRLELLADELSRPTPDVADGLRQVAVARDQTDRLSRLASDLLDLSRLDAEAPLRREPVDLAEVLRAVIAEFGARLDEQGRELEADLEPVTVDADPSACARIARVLIDNAMRYSHTGTPILVRTWSDDAGGRLTVHDEGPGIPAPDRERIFERFARGSSANSGGGFGLGLAIAAELSTRMHGSLRLETGGPGTTFALVLPLAAGVPNRIPTEASSS
jgi:signal transduction histidine kinase